jgi:hypothetical protein
MGWSDIPWRPPATTLRWFGALWLLWFASLAGVMWMLGNNVTAAVFLGVALLVGLVGLVSPRTIRPIFVGCMVVTAPIGWLVSHLLLGFVFYCLITPLGQLFRLLGRDVLGRRFNTARESYWAPKSLPKDLRSYFRMS